jgi:pimeloyl-ACP methyl ester carboxylesterase
MQRRTFPASASLSPLALSLANAQPDSTSFKTAEIDVAGNKVYYRRYGQRPAILMVHGFPRLAWNHIVVCVDLRRFGRSGTPAFYGRPLTSHRPIGPGSCCRKNSRYQRAIYSVLRRPSCIIPSDSVPSAVDSRHFLCKRPLSAGQEENPDDTAALVDQFLRR